MSAPVLSAPVAGFSDRTYRALVREFGGCGLIFTEMVSAGGWIQGTMPPGRLEGVEAEARPLGVQLWDREPDAI
ncbi:MAG TPA: tRNA-dihydrouridine synthase, partial [Terriglobales bacterium]|nr:tRNA-dihydrouridine synthase [Terriglobales bacterium]